jgi:hypothetical protein
MDAKRMERKRSAMDDMPPRRSRRPQNRRSGESTFPLIPFLIGVIVLGFVIGAGFSMAGRHGASPGNVALVTPSAEPTQSPTFAPATLAPLATPRAVESVTASAAPTHTHTPEPIAHAPSPRPTITLAASPEPSYSASPRLATAKPVAMAKPVATMKPVATATPHVALTKAPAPSPIASVAPSATAAPATTVDADSDFGRLSASVVRQYLRALGRGDTASAYGAFGVSPGSGGVAFSEQSAMQAPGQILSITARGNNQTQYVTVDIGTPTGTYYATYGVHRTSTGAAVIVTHSISKQ